MPDKKDDYEYAYEKTQILPDARTRDVPNRFTTWVFVQEVRQMLQKEAYTSVPARHRTYKAPG